MLRTNNLKSEGKVVTRRKAWIRKMDPKLGRNAPGVTFSKSVGPKNNHNVGRWNTQSHTLSIGGKKSYSVRQQPVVHGGYKNGFPRLQGEHKTTHHQIATSHAIGGTVAAGAVGYGGYRTYQHFHQPPKPGTHVQQKQISRVGPKTRRGGF